MPARGRTPEELIALFTRELFVPFRNLLFALAAVVFFWGLVEFLINQENEEKKKTGKRHMLWGLIGLAIMFAVNGILWILVNFVGQIR